MTMPLAPIQLAAVKQVFQQLSEEYQHLFSLSDLLVLLTNFARPILARLRCQRQRVYCQNH